MAKSLEEFLSRIDQKYHCKIILLEPYNGNRTNISFTKVKKKNVILNKNV